MVFFRYQKKKLSFKIDFRIKCHFQTGMKKFFESKKKLTTIGAIYKGEIYSIRDFFTE